MDSDAKVKGRVIIGCVGSLIVCTACIVTSSIVGLWGLILVVFMMEEI